MSAPEVIHYYRCDCVLVRGNGDPLPRCQHGYVPIVSAQVRDVMTLQMEIDNIEVLLPPEFHPCCPEHNPGQAEGEYLYTNKHHTTPVI